MERRIRLVRSALNSELERSSEERIDKIIETLK